MKLELVWRAQWSIYSPRLTLNGKTAGPGGQGIPTILREMTVLLSVELMAFPEGVPAWAAAGQAHHLCQGFEGLIISSCVNIKTNMHG